MSKLVCTCHCGGSMFYRHLHADSCVLSREGDEAPQTDGQATIATLTQQLAHANEQLRLYRASADDACGLRQQVAQLTAELDAHIETSTKLFSQMVGMKTELNDAQVDLTRWQAQYHELIVAVGKKYPGETRHQTALRYIKQAEDKSELRSALELCVARLEGLKEDGISQAEQQALDAANTALDADREKVKGLEAKRDQPIEQVDPQWWDVNELRANNRLKAQHISELQTQLTQLQALVRTYFKARSGNDQNEYVQAYAALKATLDATPTAAPTHNGGA